MSKTPILFFILALLSLLSSSQESITGNHTCYVNCKEGFCTDENANKCTACDSGLVQLNNNCIGGTNLPVIIRLILAANNLLKTY